MQGFRAGQLNLKKDVPAGLAQLTDPYDPNANSPYRSVSCAGGGVLDLSYYRGRLYLFFGVTPALILFWPFAALTGHYLLHRQAVAVFCTIGFLASVGLLRASWRRYFAEVSTAVVAVCSLALGLATGVPVLLTRCSVYEVAISCGYMLTTLALAAIWCALHEPERRCWWLAAASAVYGLALGARPSLLFGAVILLVPVAQAWRERRKISIPLIAATVPILLIGLGLMLYNALRFGNPFEFGMRYMLNAEHLINRQLFALSHLSFNFRVYFLEPARWSSHFPYLREIALPTSQTMDHAVVQDPFGILTNVPLVWVALVGLLAGRSTKTRPMLCSFLTAVAIFFAICALTMCLYFFTSARYEVEFLPALVLLAVIGILELELAMTARPVLRHVVRLGWCLLLGFSVTFNLLASVEHYALTDNTFGLAYSQLGKLPEAIGQYEHALQLNPGYAEAHNNLGVALARVGRIPEAIAQYEQALVVNPDYAEAYCNLGAALVRAGRTQQGISYYEKALRLKPDYAEAHYNLGTSLLQDGRLEDAMEQWRQAARLRPDFAEAHYNLGVALMRLGRLPEAVEHLEQALRINPNYAETHNSLGAALMGLGRLPEAVEHLEHALQLEPNSAEIHNNLGIALFRLGHLTEPIGHYEQALRIRPDYAEAHYNLGVALEQMGRVPEAIGHYEQALRLKPDFAAAQKALARLRGAP
ncbi:MAG TPA: tetratricopeptide repeat protein [Verrucomicrobiae bacterium]|nr:tetratricopeptide repeat protein [Verrucomicrobiae bacterium]